MKKVLFITNYFYPEYASLGQLMTDLCKGMQEKFQITVIAMNPGYTEDVKIKYKDYYKNKVNFERHETIDVFRVYATPVDKNSKLSRVMHILSYFFYSILALIKAGRQDIVFCVSQPPILGGLLGIIAKKMKGSKLIYNIQDFNPEQIEAVGYSKKRFVINLLRKLDNITIKMSDAIVLVGRDMIETLRNRVRTIDANKIHVINNWIDQRQVYPIGQDNYKIIQLKRKFGLENKRIFMYSGNIGLFYDLENLIKVFAKFKNNDKNAFVIAGEGALKSKLLEYCKENNLKNIIFVPYQDKENLIYSLNMADVHIVANLKGIKGISVPSKLYGVMGVGKPILGILEDKSEAQLIIAESKCGVCVEPGDYNKIEKLINFYIQKDDNVLIEIGSRGRAYLEENLTMEASLEKYIELINNL